MRLRHARKGQTLIEAIIALGILTTGFMGITVLLSRSFFLNRVAADNITATYLAAEGIEIAKNIIDHDVYARLATPPQGSGWGTSFGSGGDYELDYSTCASNGNCNPNKCNGACKILKYSPTNNLYDYSGSVKTKFTRDVRISTPNAGEIMVESIVTWTSGVIPQTLKLEDHFFNWHP